MPRKKAGTTDVSPDPNDTNTSVIYVERNSDGGVEGVYDSLDDVADGTEVGVYTLTSSGTVQSEKSIKERG